MFEIRPVLHLPVSGEPVAVEILQTHNQQFEAGKFLRKGCGEIDTFALLTAIFRSGRRPARMCELKPDSKRAQFISGEAPDKQQP